MGDTEISTLSQHYGYVLTAFSISNNLDQVCCLKLLLATMCLLVHNGKQQLRLFGLSFIHSIVCTLLESQNWIDVYSILLNVTENRALK